MLEGVEKGEGGGEEERGLELKMKIGRKGGRPVSADF